MAGNKDANRAQTGKSPMGINHDLHDVVANSVGIISEGSKACVPYVMRAERANNDPTTTPMVGAKFETVLRIVGVKYTLFLKFFKTVAVP